MDADTQTIQTGIDIASFFFDRWEFVVGLLLLGGASTYVTYKIRVKKSNKTNTKQGSDSQSAVTVDSPNGTAQSGGSGSNLLHASRDINIHNHAPANQTVGSPEDALRQVSVSNLSSDQVFICTEIQRLLQTRGEIFDPRDDYSRAVDLIANGDGHNSATLVIRIYGRVQNFFQTAQFFQNAQQDLTNFENSLRLMRSFHNSEDVREEISDILNNLEQAVRNLLSILRT